MPKQLLPVSIMKDPITWLYPPIEPYHTGRLQVSSIHEIYFEESGNPSGKPVIFLHGGPGGGSDPKQRRFFHPAAAGRARPTPLSKPTLPGTWSRT
jgi:proline iminopeptidase